MEVVNAIKQRAVYDESSPKKIYFSRAALFNGRDFGEKYIEQVFRQLGYQIVYPEKYSFAEQLTMLHNCESFAATEGSISHNVMFCRPEAEAIIIRKTRSCNRYQYSANKVAGCDLVYIDAHLSLFNVFGNDFGPFFLYVNDNMSRFAQSRGLSIKKHFPLLTFLHYCLYVFWYALRFRQRILIIGDAKFYWKRLREDVFS
ncbi:MAG: glycosyltransferase family 61 protein, partial [Bacteroidales bacterium]|nr:glycosyltransferase family 61 protein [Bacteroidales bacterium]